jgi:hypothetical protein
MGKIPKLMNLFEMVLIGLLKLFMKIMIYYIDVLKKMLKNVMKQNKKLNVNDKNVYKDYVKSKVFFEIMK